MDASLRRDLPTRASSSASPQAEKDLAVWMQVCGETCLRDQVAQPLRRLRRNLRCGCKFAERLAYESAKNSILTSIIKRFERWIHKFAIAQMEYFLQSLRILFQLDVLSVQQLLATL
jgi:hypothetical protein